MLHSGGHTVPGQQQELPWPWASSQHQQQLSLEGPSQSPPRGAPPLGRTDGQPCAKMALNPQASVISS